MRTTGDNPSGAGAGPPDPGSAGGAAPTPPDTTPEARVERRSNLLLRMLIDEMMQHVRELQQHNGPWPAEERARLEADLERIMSQVRAQAFVRPARQ